MGCGTTVAVKPVELAGCLCALPGGLQAPENHVDKGKRTMKYTDDQIVEIVRESIADALKVPLEDVTLNSTLTDDLDAMSIDFVDILFRLESKFNVTFHPGNPLDRMAEAVNSDALSREGNLTDLGADMIRRRMPEIDASRVSPGMPAGNVQALYKTSTWVRAVRELLDARPGSCPSCGSQDLEPVRPSVLQCRACEAEVKCPTQGELLGVWASDHLSSPPVSRDGSG